MDVSMNPRGKRRRAEKKADVVAPSFTLDSRNRGILAAVALCGLSFIAYANSFGVGFLLDNSFIIVHSPHVHEATLNNVGLIFQHSYWWPRFEAGLYRPFTTLSYLFNYAVLGNGIQPAGYHWINLMLHAGNVLLAYVLAMRVMGKFWPAVLTAAVWAVHPVLTEAVTNIVGRADLLATMSVLGGLLMYLKFTEAAGWWRVAWLAGLMAMTTVGVFSKESAVAVLGVIVLFELVWWKERPQHLELLWGCLATLVPIGAMLYQRTHVLAHLQLIDFLFIDNPIIGASFLQGRLTAIKVIARYLLIILWPVNLSIDYSYAAIPLARGTLADWISWIVVGALIAGVGLLYRRDRAAFFFACFAVVTFVPGANLLLVTGTIMGERLVYLSSLGVVACAVLGIYSLAQRFDVRLLPPLVLGSMIVLLLIRTWSRNAEWQSDVTLLRSAVEASPGSFKVHHAYAQAVYGSDPSLSRVNRVGSAASLANLNLAISEEEKSLAILDTLPDSLNNSDPYYSAAEDDFVKGEYLRQRGSNEAAAVYAHGLAIAVRALPLFNADYRYARSGERAHAGGSDSTSTDQDPDAYVLLSFLYLRTGGFERALEMGQVARSLTPLRPEIHGVISDALLGLGRRNDAAVALAEGLILTDDPGLQQKLVESYRTSDPTGCETISRQEGLQINASCDGVRRDFCAASVDAIKLTLRAGRRDLAESEEHNLLENYHCARGPMEELLQTAPKP